MHVQIGETAADRQKWRNEVLNTSAEDFAEFAARMKTLKVRWISVCVVSGICVF